MSNNDSIKDTEANPNWIVAKARNFALSVASAVPIVNAFVEASTFTEAVDKATKCVFTLGTSSAFMMGSYTPDERNAAKYFEMNGMMFGAMTIGGLLHQAVSKSGAINAVSKSGQILVQYAKEFCVGNDRVNLDLTETTALNQDDLEGAFSSFRSSTNSSKRPKI